MIKINKIDIQIFLMLLPFMEPWWFTRVGIIDFVFDFAKLCVCFIVLIMILDKKIRIGSISLLFMVYRIYICIVTVLEGITVLGYFSESIQLVCFCMLLEYFIKKYGIRVLKSVVILFSIILVLNVITYTPGGIIFEPNSGYYLLGIRTRIAEVAFPAIGIALYNYRTTKKNKILYYIVFCSSIIFFFLEWVATALTCICLLIFLLLTEKLVFKRFEKYYQNVLLIAILIISLGVVFFNIQEIFADSIESILHKQATLTGRTDLWKIALNHIREKWLFGYGYKNQGNFIAMFNFVTTSHNQWLQTMFYGGVVGSIIYYFIPLYAIKKSRTKRNNINRKNSILMTAYLKVSKNNCCIY